MKRTKGKICKKIWQKKSDKNLLQHNQEKNIATQLLNIITIKSYLVNKK